MAYNRTNWQSGVTPINATNMNNIEDGVELAVNTAESTDTSLDNHKTYSNPHDGVLFKILESKSQSVYSGPVVYETDFAHFDYAYVGSGSFSRSVDIDIKYNIASTLDDNEAWFLPRYNNFSDKFNLGSSTSRWYELWVQGVMSLTVSSDEYITTSDKRLKTEIENLDDKYTDFIMGLNPVSYKFKDKGKVRLGLIAQDVEKTLEEKGLTELSVVQYDEKQDIYGVSYQELIAPLIATVQNQQKEIDELKALIKEAK